MQQTKPPHECSTKQKPMGTQLSGSPRNAYSKRHLNPSLDQSRCSTAWGPEVNIEHLVKFGLPLFTQKAFRQIKWFGIWSLYNIVRAACILTPNLICSWDLCILGPFHLTWSLTCYLMYLEVVVCHDSEILIVHLGASGQHQTCPLALCVMFIETRQCKRQNPPGNKNMFHVFCKQISLTIGNINNNQATLAANH